MIKTFLTFATFFAVFGLASALRGDTIYDYTSSLITSGSTTCQNDGCQLEITMDLTAPLPGGLTQTFVDPNSFTISLVDESTNAVLDSFTNLTPGLNGVTATGIGQDGINGETITTAGAFDFQTDASGNIITWSICADISQTPGGSCNKNGGLALVSNYADNATGYVNGGLITNFDGLYDGPALQDGIQGLANLAGPSGWTVETSQITATPEPATIGLTAAFLGGLLFIDIRRRKRKARHARAGAIPDDEFDPNEPEPPGFERRDTGALQAILEFEYLTSRGWRCPDGRKFYHVTEPTDPSRHTGWSMRDALTIQLNRDRIITGCEDPAAYSPLLGWLTADNEMISRAPSPDSEPPPAPPVPNPAEPVAA